MYFKYESLLCFISLVSVLISSICYKERIVNWLIPPSRRLGAPREGAGRWGVSGGRASSLADGAFSRRPHVAKSRGEQASPWDSHVGTLPSCPNRPPETLPASATTLRGGIATHTLGRTQTFRPEHVASCNRHRGGHAGTGRPSEETRRGRDGGVGTVRQPCSGRGGRPPGWLCPSRSHRLRAPHLPHTPRRAQRWDSRGDSRPRGGRRHLLVPAF